MGNKKLKVIPTFVLCAIVISLFAIVVNREKIFGVNSENKLLNTEIVNKKLKNESVVSEPIVSILNGSIRGFVKNFQNDTIYTFLGIPFAAPPIGNLRFSRPQPVQKWNKIKNTTQWPFGCIQITSPDRLSTYSLTSEFSEDCLYLNIWTPKIKQCNHNLLPVIVYIHGGAFLHGFTAVDTLDGHVLSALGNVVFVSIQYRIGPLGFLNLDIDEAPGNVGLWDQVMALKWIKKNIKSFCGNNTMITLLGMSSGGWSIGLHLLSPISKHLFDRAIIMSGSPLMINIGKRETEADQFANQIGCSDGINITVNETPQLVLTCLRETEVQHLKNISNIMASKSLGTFVPIIPDEDFLNESPSQIFNNDQLIIEHKLLFGTVTNEGSAFISDIMKNKYKQSNYSFPNLTSLDDAKNFIFNDILPDNMSMNEKESLFNLFFKMDKNRTSLYYLRKISDVIGSVIIKCPVLRFAYEISKHSNEGNVMVYHLNQRASISFYPKWTEVNHSEDDYFIMGYPLRYPNRFTRKEIELSRKMMEMISSFATKGEVSYFDGIYWPPFTPEKQSFIEIKAKSSKTGDGLFDKYCDKFNLAFDLFN